MFYTTTHYRNWIFSDEEELERRRHEANSNFITESQKSLHIDLDNVCDYFLTMEEEANLITHYLTIMKDFCRKFQPNMPKCVISTSIQYFKRFYLNNSAMEYPPKHIMVTCVYLAAKIEEFNVSMQQFVNNVRGDRDKASEIVLNNELLLLHRLNYQLTIWHPYRPIEGFLIDLKTRFPQCRDPEKYRRHIDAFLDRSFSTDACFLLCPNQLALLAVIFAAEQFNEALDDYLQILFQKKQEEIKFIQKWYKKINEMMANVTTLSKEEVKQIEKKLERCQADSVFGEGEQQRRIDDDDEEQSTVPYEQYSQYRNEQDKMEQEFIERSAN